MYKGRLISNAQLHVTRKWKGVVKWNTYGIKVYFICYKNLHLFFHVIIIYSYRFLPTVNQLSHPVNEECWWAFLDQQPHCVFQFIICDEMNTLISLFKYHFIMIMFQKLFTTCLLLLLILFCEFAWHPPRTDFTAAQFCNCLLYTSRCV